MSAATLAAIGQGVSSLAGSALGFLGQQSANRSNLELAKYSYQKDLEMWYRQNAYNSPTEQMARLKAAGLNPNLVYGNGSAVNVASNAPQMKTPHMEAYRGYNLGIGDAVGTYMQMQQNQASTELAKTQRDSVQADIDTKRLQQAGMISSNAKNAVEAAIAEQTKDAVINQIWNRSNQSAEEMNTSVYTRKMKQLEMNVANDLYNNNSHLRLSNAQIDNISTAAAKLKQDMDIDKFDQDLYIRTGISKRDAIYWRIFSSVMRLISPTLGGKLDNIFNPR